MLDVFEILKLIHQYRKNQYLPHEKIRDIQRRKLERLVRFSRKHSPFFQEFYRQVPEKGFKLDDLPPITKKTMMQNFDNYCTDRRLKLDPLRKFVHDSTNIGKKYMGYTAFHTSGTTGEPAILVYDSHAFNCIKAINFARGMAWETTPRRVLEALFKKRLHIATVLMDGGLYPGYSNFVNLPRSAGLFTRVKVFSMRQPLEEIVAGLNEFDPDILTGYANMLKVLGYEQISGRLQIMRGVEKAIVSFSEPLEPQTRTLLEQAFHCPVTDVYGSGECLTIATSCMQNSAMHICTDFVILEVIDSEGRPVGPGVPGHKVLLTNLENYVQPFIRYEVSDIVTLSDEKCACGRNLPLIKEIQGRTDDILFIANHKGGYSTVHPYIIVVALLDFPSIKDYQATQIDRNCLEIAVVAEDGKEISGEKIHEAVMNSFRQSKIDANIEIRIRTIDKLTPDPISGKIRRVWSRIGPPAA